jgi:hypothetical protein
VGPQRCIKHGVASMPTRRILYAVNSLFASVLAIAGCTVNSAL